ncbi:ENTH-domain-containing protein [Tuber magnatum]|uniref:ENTH-domain-containing protein n=1 Tax=Tuber magnatum TaxID=42249 RepID=A0A317SLK1_9PEZI|nr:ENTH-domain-containing protein [Tuber magnatum]
MSKVIRTVKNVTKGYSSTQVKVRNATSNDPWGPTGTEMSDIAHMTFETTHEFFEIMDMLDKRLNDKGKNWRHVLKALKVLDYCLHEGSEHVVVWAKDNIYIIKTLREFQFIDEDGRDQGLNVRISAKELTSLIMDEDRLRNERKDRKSWKSRGPRTSSSRQDEEDLEYRLAIEASKNQAEEDKKRSANKQPELDDDLAKAIKLSKEEEELRQRELEQNNADSLFDDAAPTQSQPQTFQPAGYQPQQYQQLDQVDFFGNPVSQTPLQQQNTSYLANVYSNPTGLPQQQFPQPTGFDQSQMQFGVAHSNSYAPPPSLSPQQTNFIQPGDNNPYANGPATQPLQPLPTGSNNPFAPKINSFNAAMALPMLSLDSMRQQQAQTYKQPSFPNQSPQNEKPINPQHARLESLLASGNDSGLDTYGNVGNLRIPAQHTAPGTFVNSAGTSRTGRTLAAQSTGTNPFFNQQFTGVPQSTGFGNSLSPQPNRLLPSHTGPAGMNGYGAGGFGQQQQPNPYASGFGQPQQKQQGGNLIDL